MLRIHFTPSDLARVQLAREPDPMWEILLSLHMLQDSRQAPVFGEWRQLVRHQLAPELRPLIALAPPRGYSPDFLTPAEGDGGLAAGLDAVRRTPKRHLRRDLTVFAVKRRAPGLRSLAEGDGAALEQLTGRLRSYHRLALEPWWSQIRTAVTTARGPALRRHSHDGVDALLGGLHPRLNWQRPVLEVRGLTVDRDVRLDGRGLRLVPSFFCWQHPIMLRDQELPPVLVYPIDPADVWLPQPARAPARPLAALLGDTRAAVLAAVADGPSTSDLARRLGISVATVSYHTTVLRDAGLITTTREGSSVTHILRMKGAMLLHAE